MTSRFRQIALPLIRIVEAEVRLSTAGVSCSETQQGCLKRPVLRSTVAAIVVPPLWEKVPAHR